MTTAAGTLDLISRVAAILNETDICQKDPKAWYRGRFGLDPDYSGLLEQLATSPAERAAALARYFDGPSGPGEETPQPTRAHKEIAKMVSGGYIRVIVTTNFDRLMERALEAQGISPMIIATPDAMQGALPLAHSTCTLITLHGDYRDTRLRNPVMVSEEELDAMAKGLWRSPREHAREDPPPYTPFEQLMFYFQKRLDGALVCERPGCSHPYFFRQSPRDTCCSEDCRNERQKVRKLARYHSHDKFVREKKLKSKERGRPRRIRPEVI